MLTTWIAVGRRLPAPFDNGKTILVYSMDSGNSWTQINLPGGETVQPAESLWDGRNAHIVGTTSYLRGSSQEDIALDSAFAVQNLLGLAIGDGGRMATAGGNTGGTTGKQFISDDRGETWSAFGTADQLHLIQYGGTGDVDRWVGTSFGDYGIPPADGRTYVLDDDGVTWHTNFGPAGAGRPTDIWTDGSTGKVLVCTSGGKIIQHTGTAVSDPFTVTDTLAGAPVLSAGAYMHGINVVGDGSGNIYPAYGAAVNPFVTGGSPNIQDFCTNGQLSMAITQDGQIAMSYDSLAWQLVHTLSPSSLSSRPRLYTCFAIPRQPEVFRYPVYWPQIQQESWRQR